MKNCSSIIRNLLKEKNITEADLARKINTTGPNLAKWLQTEDWKISKLVNVCSALNIPITTFIDNAEIGNVITEPDVSLKHERNPFNLLSERFEEIEKDIIELKKQNATLHRDIKKLSQK